MRITDEHIHQAHRRAKYSLIIMWACLFNMLFAVIRYNWLGGYAWDLYIAVGLYFLSAVITWYLIERSKKLLNKKIAQTKYRWDTIEGTSRNWRNN